MNLPATTWLGSRRRRSEAHGLRVHASDLLELRLGRPGLLTVGIAMGIFAVSGVLEALNPGNYWLVFEDVSCGVVPVFAAAAVFLAALHGEPRYRRFRISLATSLALTAFGQVMAIVPDITHRSLGPLAALSDVSYVVGALIGTVTLIVSLYGRLQRDARRAVLLDGVLIMTAGMTFVFANWLHQSFLPGYQVTYLLADPGPNLFVPMVSTLFFASAGVGVVAALALRIEPARRGVWPVVLGIVLLGLAWEGWIGRFLAGTPDGIEPMDFIFPAGMLATAYGGVTWTVRQGGGELYDRLAKRIADWLPMAAIVGCAFLDVMPRTRPFEVDPIAVGTCVVVMLTVGRQSLLQGRARDASERLKTEISERAATTVSLARLEAAPTVEETAQRICSEALRIDGIDRVVVYVFSPTGVMPLAEGGPRSRPVEIGEILPETPGLELQEHAAFGLWLESWADRTPRHEFDSAVIASGLRAEALAPLVWNDETIGVISMGATTQVNASRLADRLATLTEFSVMSAAVLGPALSEMWQRDMIRAEIENVIATRAFHPVFQPIVDLITGEHVGFEALTRFDDGTRPDLRFLAADKVGMMERLETACLHEQVKEARGLPAGSFLTLNVSPVLAIQLTPLVEVLDEADRPCVLEVTEHVEIEDYEPLLAALDQVRARARLAVDDAGAGYAGLRHILELRPQFVKLDISLVRNVDTDPARQAMVTGMAHFADIVGCDMIAEGIETANEHNALRLLGVKYGQGYKLARPQPIAYWVAK
jgi:EAL domain-containing protein (putative c-di-GMP-specific phosphodiesterase class I)